MARKAAQEAVRETLEKLGVDVNNISETQQDFAWIRDFRLTSEKLKMRGLMTAVTIIVSGLAGLVWMAIHSPPS